MFFVLIIISFLKIRGDLKKWPKIRGFETPLQSYALCHPELAQVGSDGACDSYCKKFDLYCARGQKADTTTGTEICKIDESENGVKIPDNGCKKIDVSKKIC